MTDPVQADLKLRAAGYMPHNFNWYLPPSRDGRVLSTEQALAELDELERDDDQTDRPA